MEWRCRFLALTMVHDTCLNYVDRTANQSHTCITIRQMRCDGLKFGGCIGSAESNCRCICLRPAARPCKARSTTVHNHHRSKSTPTPTEKKSMFHGERNNVPVDVPGLHRGAERTKAFPRYPDCHAFNWQGAKPGAAQASRGAFKELESGSFAGTAQNM